MAVAVLLTGVLRIALPTELRLADAPGLLFGVLAVLMGGVTLFSDEVYRGLELDPARTLPQAADLSERARWSSATPAGSTARRDGCGS